MTKKHLRVLFLFSRPLAHFLRVDVVVVMRLSICDGRAQTHDLRAGRDDWCAVPIRAPQQAQFPL